MPKKSGATEVGKKLRIIGPLNGTTMPMRPVLIAATLLATTRDIPTGRERHLAALGGPTSAGELFWHERDVGIRHLQSVLCQQAMHLTPMVGLMVGHVGDELPTRLGYLAPRRR